MRHFVGCWAQAVSIALQFGVPWEMISNKIDNTPGRPMLCAIVDSINEAIAERIRIIGLDEPAVVPAKEETSHKPIDVLG